MSGGRLRGTAALLVALVVLSSLAGCDRTPADAWFPLGAGHRWTYLVTTRPDGAAPLQEHLHIDTLVPHPDDRRGDGIAGYRRSDRGAAYWLRADASGVARVASQGVLDEAPRGDPPGRYVLKAPYAVGTTWRASTTAYLLTRKFDFPREVRHTYPAVPMDYRIEAVDDAVETPAGRYDGCLRVAGSAKIRVYADPVNGWRELPFTSLEWYCRGVGLVRLERREPVPSPFMLGGSLVMELQAFK